MRWKWGSKELVVFCKWCLYRQCSTERPWNGGSQFFWVIHCVHCCQGASAAFHLGWHDMWPRNFLESFSAEEQLTIIYRYFEARSSFAIELHTASSKVVLFAFKGKFVLSQLRFFFPWRKRTFVLQKQSLSYYGNNRACKPAHHLWAGMPITSPCCMSEQEEVIDTFKESCIWRHFRASQSRCPGIRHWGQDWLSCKFVKALEGLWIRKKQLNSRGRGFVCVCRYRWVAVYDGLLNTVLPHTTFIFYFQLRHFVGFSLMLISWARGGQLGRRGQGYQVQ